MRMYNHRRWCACSPAVLRSRGIRARSNCPRGKFVSRPATATPPEGEVAEGPARFLPAAAPCHPVTVRIAELRGCTYVIAGTWPPAKKRHAPAPFISLLQM